MTFFVMYESMYMQEYSNLTNDVYGFDHIEYEQSCTWPTIITSFRQNLGNTTGSSLGIEIFQESEYYLEIRNSNKT